jgi:hypothetical protein
MIGFERVQRAVIAGLYHAVEWTGHLSVQWCSFWSVSSLHCVCPFILVPMRMSLVDAVTNAWWLLLYRLVEADHKSKQVSSHIQILLLSWTLSLHNRQWYCKCVGLADLNSPSLFSRLIRRDERMLNNNWCLCLCVCWIYVMLTVETKHKVFRINEFSIDLIKG